MTKTILITSARSPAGLDLLRLFSRLGHRVIVAESFPVHLAQYSRYGKSFRVPSPNADPEKYIHRISELVAEHSVDLIIPCYEEIFPLAHFRDRLGCELLADDFFLLKKLHDKYSFIRLCEEHQCSHPNTKLVHSADEIQDPQSKVLKPRFSRFGTDVYLRPSMQQIEKLDFSQPWVMQDFIEGESYCGFCFADHGEILFHGIYPVEITWKGVCISFRHREVALIRQWMNEFVGRIGFTGFIGFDLVLRDEVVYPIECNPRITSGIHLFSGRTELADSILEIKKMEPFRPLQSMAGPFVLAQAMWRWSLWKTWWQSKDVILDWKDPLPLLGQIAGMFYLAGSAVLKGVPMSQASSLDLDYNGIEFDNRNEEEPSLGGSKGHDS